jgi:hypothetical protein
MADLLFVSSVFEQGTYKTTFNLKPGEKKNIAFWKQGETPKERESEFTFNVRKPIYI